MKKFLRVGVILLFLVGTLVQPNDSCRVLIKSKEENVLVLQNLQKAPERPPGNPEGYTPGGPKLAADATNKAPEHTPGNPDGYTPGGPKLTADATNKAPERTPGNPDGYTPGGPKLTADATNKAPERTPGNPDGYTPNGPKLAVDTTNTRAFAGRAMAPPRVVTPVAFKSSA